MGANKSGVVCETGDGEIKAVFILVYCIGDKTLKSNDNEVITLTQKYILTWNLTVWTSNLGLS